MTIETASSSRYARNMVGIFQAACILSLFGCVTYGDVDNLPQIDRPADKGYSIANSQRSTVQSDTAVLLAFSGGGTRAAALAFGVMKTLRDTQIATEHDTHRLLDDVRGISAVSGGSFTAAYYGLNGDDLFNNFETDFLRRNVAGALFRNLWNPLHWFSRRGRTDFATDYYDQSVFKGATFADLQRRAGPLILINATDLGRGVRFSFVQEYFDLLCSDLSSFPIARAVAASSAVPVVFHPVVLRQQSDCKQTRSGMAGALTEQVQGDAELALLLKGLAAYQSNDEDAYVHLVDGGISDNLGLRSLYELISVAGGAKSYFGRFHRTPPKRIVVISVNAAIQKQFNMNHSNRRPSVSETLLATSELQLQRYNATTLNLIKANLDQWTKELSDENRSIESWFIELDFNDVKSERERESLNAIPTTLALRDEDIDHLIRVGQQLLTNDESFQDLLNDIAR